MCQLWLDPTQTLNSISHQLGVTSSSLYRQAAKLELPIPRSAIDSAGSKISLGHTMKDVSYQRAQWLALVKGARGKGRTALRTRSHGVYEWLNCYDREWLLAHLPAKIQPRKSEISKHARSSGLPLPSVRAGRGPLKKASSREFVLHQDAYVAQCVRAAAYRLMNCQNPPKRVTARRISIDVPQVLQLKRIADKAPLTMQAVEAVTETSEIFAVRCIRWAVQKYQEESLCPTRGEFVRKLNLHHVLHALVVQQALDEAMDVLSRFT